MQVVWLKRDLRVQDNRALALAAERGEVLALYVAEPDLWEEPDMSGRQWAFIADSLRALQADLYACGQRLVIRTGDVIDVLNNLADQVQISALWSHEETGNGWTYRRDQKVAAWCRAQNVTWHQVRNHGVQRRLASRDGWAKNWDRFMAEPVTQAPRLKPHEIDPGAIPSARDLGLASETCDQRQTGGRPAAIKCLDMFLTKRGENYRRAMSTPLEGAEACSRLSPHLAWGTVSMREVAQATWARQRALKQGPRGSATNWRASLRSFAGRLHWHCHFMQKLEDEPRMEFENLHRGLDGVRPSVPDRAKLESWSKGETGFPFVDACMRSLKATGWLNFRMRAMVMAMASYHLWLPWRAPGLVLARLFTDYEPGIHWSQVQMQSGTTGINTVRVYNPVKQGHDQDPTGAFTRAWVPELADIPDQFLQEPWKADNAGAVVGRTYPERTVDHVAAAKEARERIWAVRRGDAFRTKASAIQAKHGSRRSGVRNRGQRTNARSTDQLSLPLSGADR